MQAQHLSIRLRPDGFSFSVNSHDETVVLISPGPDRLRGVAEAITERDILLPTEGDSTTVDCEVGTTRFAVVPPATPQATAESMFRLTVPETTDEEVLLRDGLVIFGVERGFYDFMQRTYTDLTWHHPISRLMTLSGDTLGTAGKPADEATTVDETLPSFLIAQVGSGAVDVLVYRHARLQLANRYETTDIGNIVYYLMNTWRQCGLNALADKMIMAGDASLAARLRVHIAPLVKHLQIYSTLSVDKSMPTA